MRLVSTRRHGWLLLCGVALCPSRLTVGSPRRRSRPTARRRRSPTTTHVRPIFRNRCFSCHNQDQAKSDLALDAYNTAMQGGAGGKSVVGRRPGEVAALAACERTKTSRRCRPSRTSCRTAELATIKSWIEGGCPGERRQLPARHQDRWSICSCQRRLGKPDRARRRCPIGWSRSQSTVAERPGAVTALAASPWAPLVAVAGQKQVLLYNTDSAELLGVLPFPEGQAHVLKFSRNGTLLLAGGGRAASSGKVVVFDVKTGKRVAEVGDELDVVLAADISADHTMIALGGPRKVVRVYARPRRRRWSTRSRSTPTGSRPSSSAPTACCWPRATATAACSSGSRRRPRVPRPCAATPARSPTSAGGSIRTCWPAAAKTAPSGCGNGERRPGPRLDGPRRRGRLGPVHARRPARLHRPRPR